MRKCLEAVEIHLQDPTLNEKMEGSGAMDLYFLENVIDTVVHGRFVLMRSSSGRLRQRGGRLETSAR